MITAFAVFVAVFFNPLLIQGAAVCKDCDSCVGQKAVKNIRSHLQSAKDVLERLDTTKTKFNVGPWISFFQLADLTSFIEKKKGRSQHGS
ncbi:hypothetical protein RB195_011919 [Necator americanus]|uniref:Secreted protein n=1 Tax=Necator americanus TaxID=51031 RepID=A0ABR1D5X6_NECAM